MVYQGCHVFHNRIRELNYKSSHSKAIYCDARALSYQEEFDAIITSPPFGEEKNTIGYARWSRPYMSWLRLNGKILQNEDKLALGSKVSKDVEKNLKEIPSITASTLLRKVLEKDRQRVSDAVTFFFDYLKTLQEMYRVLKPRSYCCIVIGELIHTKKCF